MISKTKIENGIKFCCEDIRNIENYEEAVKSDKMYVCHHRNGLNIPAKELIEKGLYYDRPANELIFLEIGEHIRLHNSTRIVSGETKQKISESLKGRLLSNETKQKMSNSRNGEKNGMYGKKHSEESKEKMSEAKKGKYIGENNPMFGKGDLLTGEKNGMYGKGYLIAGENNPNAKKCTINGITYGSITDAHKALYPNMSSSTFYYKYKNNKL